jgi:hypothetical protein
MQLNQAIIDELRDYIGDKGKLKVFYDKIVDNKDYKRYSSELDMIATLVGFLEVIVDYSEAKENKVPTE